MADNPKSFSEQNGLVDKTAAESNASNLSVNGVEQGIQQILQSLRGIQSAISDGMETISQSNARVYSDGKDPSKVFRTRNEDRQGSKQKQPKDFWDGVSSEISKEIFGTDYKKALGSIANNFAKTLGTDLEHLPGKIGQMATRSVINSFKNTEMGKEASKKFEEIKGRAVGKVKDYVRSRFEQGAASSYEKQGMSPEDAKKAASGLYGRITHVAKGDNVQPQSESDKDRAENQVKDFAEGQAKKFARDKIKDFAKQGLDTVTSGGAEMAGMTSGGAEMAAAASEGGAAFTTTAEGAGVVAEMGAAAEGASAAGAASASLAGALEVIIPLISAAAPYIVAAIAVIGAVTIAAKLVEKEFNDMKEATKAWFDTLKTSSNRYAESRKKNLELANKRLEEDVHTMVETPFKILEDAAQKAYDVWDNTLRTITATQGYNKSSYQDLLGAYAERLRDEGLGSVISSTDIASNLEKVLTGGLTGRIAEEFAYQATLLNAAIPTQDFFSYASTYAEIVANLVKDGKSQEQAISFANDQLNTFASSVLYAGRELSGGITTGLQDAQSLFDSSVKIAAAARTGNASQIAGVLTSVSAITGAIAPDLATGLVDAVVKAATGGNDSSIVALRSLAGINASNTEFLQAFAKDPQKIFGTLFKNLDKYAKSSNDAYMEVAEGLAPIFGLSSDAFARMDFEYLADAVLKMKVDGSALDKNMKLLIQGETTTSAEMHRIQEVNKVLVEEGLSLVLDNEAARAIQQHMWDEQIARELMEADYGVQLVGKTAEMLESIRMFIEKIVKLLNPFKWFSESAINLLGTTAEAAGQQADIRNLLIAGRVGNGNTKALYNLVTRNQDLNLTNSLLSKFGAFSAYEAAKGIREVAFTVNRLRTPSPIMAAMTLSDLGGKAQQGIANLLGGSVLNPLKGSTSLSKFSGRSSYGWNSVSKSQASLLSTVSSFISGLFEDTAEITSNVLSQGTSAQSLLATKLGKMTESSYIQKMVDEGKSYKDWVASAAKFGISDLDSAMTEMGLSKNQVEEAFTQKQTEKGEEIQKELEMLERKFWEESSQHFEEARTHYAEAKAHFEEATIHYGKAATYFETTFVDYAKDAGGYFDYVEKHIVEKTDPFYISTSAYLKDIVDALTGDKGIHKTLSDFWSAWERYYITRVQNGMFLSFYEAGRVNQEIAQNNQDAIYNMASMISKNSASTERLMDPTVQTNTLLSKILLLVQAILDQGAMSGGGGGTTLLDSMTALSLGLTRNVNMP